MSAKSILTGTLLGGAVLLAAGCAVPLDQPAATASQRSATPDELRLIRDGVAYRTPDPANAAIRNVVLAGNAPGPDGTPVCGEVNSGYLGFVPFQAFLRPDGGLTVVEVATGANGGSVVEACRGLGVVLGG